MIRTPEELVTVLGPDGAAVGALPDLERGRLREHRQWNVDCIGLAGPDADAEVIAVAVTALRLLGLTASDIRVRISHRGAASAMLEALGVPSDRIADAFVLVDRREKLPAEVFKEQAAALGLDDTAVGRLEQLAAVRMPATEPVERIATEHALPEDSVAQLGALAVELDKRGLLPFCDWDLGIVRGLACTIWMAVWERRSARPNSSLGSASMRAW